MLRSHRFKGYCLQAEATGTAPFTYLWEGGSTDQTLCIFEPNQGGTYCVTITDAEDCTSTACGNIVNIPDCDVQITQDTLWGSTDLLLTAEAIGLPPFSYQWSTLETSQSIIVSQSGTYCVTITDDLGCTSEACAVVENPNASTCTCRY